MQNSENKTPRGSYGFVLLSALLLAFVWWVYDLTDVGWCAPSDVLCHFISFLHSIVFIALVGAGLLFLLSILVFLSALRNR